MRYTQPANDKSVGMTPEEVRQFLDVLAALTDNNPNIGIRANVTMGGKIKEMYGVYEKRNNGPTDPRIVTR